MRQRPQGASAAAHFQLTFDGDHAGTVIALLYGADCLFQGLLGDLLVLLGNRIDPDRQEIQQLRVTKGRQSQLLWPQQVPLAQRIEDAFEQDVGGGDQRIGQRAAVEQGEHLFTAARTAELFGLQDADLTAVLRQCLAKTFLALLADGQCRACADQGDMGGGRNCQRAGEQGGRFAIIADHRAEVLGVQRTVEGDHRRASRLHLAIALVVGW